MELAKVHCLKLYLAKLSLIVETPSGVKILILAIMPKIIMKNLRKK
jgi:hypothetical protein